MAYIDAATEMRSIFATGLALTALAGCSGASGAAVANNGGSASGGSSSGGASTSAVLTGGASTGGATSSVNVGGSAVIGGSSSASGGPSTGGNLATGGANVTGGASASGGAPATGGAMPTGGLPATGGSKAGGGMSNVGGSKTGGAPSTGGSVTTGGSVNNGGTGNTAGTSNSTGCGNTNLPAACATKGSPCTLNVAGTDRQYYVVLPTNYDANTPYPLVFTWHGLNGTADQFLPGSYMGGSGGFYGVRSGYPNAIYVTSQGLPAGMNDSGTDYGWPNTNGRDVAFTKAMIDWFESNFCIDKNRLFSVGMSFGGMMSDTLGCQMPDVFRALGVMSGSLYTGFGQTCVSHPIAAWFTHGTADTTVDISGDVTARDQFIADNGCDTINTQTVTMDSNTTCTIYNVCTAGNYPVVWCPVNGEGHTIPSWAGSEISTFFAQF